MKFNKKKTHSNNSEWNSKQSDEQVGDGHRQYVVIRFALQLVIAANHINHHRVADDTATEEPEIQNNENDLNDQQK